MKILKFYGENCMPCKMLKQSMETVVDVLPPMEEINTDLEENLETMRKYNIRSVPVLVLVDDSEQEIARSVGYKTNDQIMSAFGISEKKVA